MYLWRLSQSAVLYTSNMTALNTHTLMKQYSFLGPRETQASPLVPFIEFQALLKDTENKRWTATNTKKNFSSATSSTSGAARVFRYSLPENGHSVLRQRSQPVSA